MPLVKEQLQSAEGFAVRGVKEAEGADAVDAFGQYVLEESTKKLCPRQRHRLTLLIAIVAIAKRDGLLVARHDGSIRERGLVHVAAEIFEDLVGPLRGRLGEDDPILVAVYLGKLHLR